jgi:hypothetical protein
LNPYISKTSAIRGPKWSILNKNLETNTYLEEMFFEQNPEMLSKK